MWKLRVKKKEKEKFPWEPVAIGLGLVGLLAVAVISKKR